MAYETIIYETDGPLARITLNRPERLNAITLKMPDELERAVAEANANPQVRVIVLRGAGRAFCAGFDLEPGLFSGSSQWDPVADYSITTTLAAKFMSLWYSRKPTIARCMAGVWPAAPTWSCARTSS